MLCRGLMMALLMGCCALAYAAEAKLKADVEEFIFTKAPFRECHASTIVELVSGDLLAAWFGGQQEGDKSVAIWLSRKPRGGVWSSPVKVASYNEVPCWNPVLFRNTKGTVWLFFKVGPDEESWIGAYRTSTDGGKTWSDVTYLPAGMLGPSATNPFSFPMATYSRGHPRKPVCGAGTASLSPIGVGRPGLSSVKMAAKPGRFTGPSLTLE